MAEFIDEALSRLTSASKQPARSRAQPIERTTRAICDGAYRDGLSAGNLAIIVDIVRKPSCLDQGTVTQIIKNLYPATPIIPEVIYNVVSSIGPGSGKPSIATQALFLQWLLLVREGLTQETEAALERCYGVLFNQLGALGTRPALCHLLAILTRRKHVKPWRIRALLDLARNATTDNGLLSLLRVYKDFYPSIVLDQPLLRVTAAGFKVPDLEWRQRLAFLQKGHADGTATGASSFRVLRRGAKRSRLEIVPEVYTANAFEDSVSLEEIDSVADFVERLHRIEPPSQIVAALDDSLLQKYLYLKDSDALRGRLDTWLSFYLDSQLSTIGEGAVADNTLDEVLPKILHYVRRTKSLPPSVLTFLSRILDNWDGLKWHMLILELFSFLPLQSFDSLHNALLSRLENSLLSIPSSPNSSSDPLISLLRTYISLFRHWTTLLLHSPNSHSSPTIDALASHMTVLVKQILTSDPPLSHSTFVLSYLSSLSHVAKLAPTHPNMRILSPDALAVYLLAFQNLSLATLSPLCNILAAYKVAFENSMVQINSRTSLSHSQTSPTPTPTSTPAKSSAAASLPLAPTKLRPYARDYINAFNGFLMDLCNLVWRSRAFNNTDINAKGCLISQKALGPLRTHLESRSPGHTLASIFSISFHPALAAVAISVMREIEDRAFEGAELSKALNGFNSRSGRKSTGIHNGDAAAMDLDRIYLDDSESGGSASESDIPVRHAGPVTQKSLATLDSNGGVKLAWAEYRLEVLKWMERHGVGGVSLLMFSTMKHLMAGKKEPERASTGARGSDIKGV